MKNDWIDFRALRDRLDFAKVLEHYGVEVKRRGDQHMGFCPLPNHNGNRNSPSFSANLTKGIFQCFGCGARGNVLEFAALMNKAEPKDGQALRQVALALQERFCPGLGDVGRAPQCHDQPKPVAPADDANAIVNAPLDFELKGLVADHPYLLGRGFTNEIIRNFGLGYCGRGLLKTRVAIPLHDSKGSLIGYAGRVVDDAAISEDNPRYRFPGERKKNGTVFAFRKTHFLYNGNRIKPHVDDLIVVEGFTSVWWLTQHGFPNIVATMGSDCSENQAGLLVALVKPSGRVWIMSDGDKAGDRHAQTIMPLIAPHRFVRWIRLPDGRQPTDMSAGQLKTSFTF